MEKKTKIIVVEAEVVLRLTAVERLVQAEQPMDEDMLDEYDPEYDHYTPENIVFSVDISLPEAEQMRTLTE